MDYLEFIAATLDEDYCAHEEELRKAFEVRAASLQNVTGKPLWRGVRRLGLQEGSRHFGTFLGQSRALLKRFTHFWRGVSYFGTFHRFP